MSRGIEWALSSGPRMKATESYPTQCGAPAKKLASAAVGILSKMFFYERPTEDGIIDIRKHWVRIVPRVKLEVTLVVDRSADHAQFLEAANSVLESIILDRDRMRDLRRRYEKEAST